jgi:hypothetical protein
MGVYIKSFAARNLGKCKGDNYKDHPQGDALAQVG